MKTSLKWYAVQRWVSVLLSGATVATIIMVTIIAYRLGH